MDSTEVENQHLFFSFTFGLVRSTTSLDLDDGIFRCKSMPNKGQTSRCDQVPNCTLCIYVYDSLQNSIFATAIIRFFYWDINFKHSNCSLNFDACKRCKLCNIKCNNPSHYVAYRLHRFNLFSILIIGAELFIKKNGIF